MNWRAYDASLRQRGRLKVWFTDDAIEAWRAPLVVDSMQQGRAWRMLTGNSRPMSALSEDQVVRVAHLLEIDRGIREVGGKPVDEWMVLSNPDPFFGGTPLAAPSWHAAREA